MAKGGIPSIPDHIMDGNPKLLELLNHVQTIKWKELGMQLEIPKIIRDGCNSCPDIYDKWLAVTPKPKKTRRKLITALKAINEVALADEYMEYLATVSLNNRIM